MSGLGFRIEAVWGLGRPLGRPQARNAVAMTEHPWPQQRQKPVCNLVKLTGKRSWRSLGRACEAAARSCGEQLLSQDTHSQQDVEAVTPAEMKDCPLLLA